MTAPEFSRVIRAHEIGGKRREAIAANEAERAALAARFGLLSLDSLEADLTLRREAAGIRVTGRVRAIAEQACTVSDQPVPARVDEDVDLLFVEEAHATPDEEVELSSTDCDVISYDGQAIDVGEAAAQSFSLALEPYPRASDEALAEARRHLTSEEEAEAQAEADKRAASPFAALKRG